MRSRLVMGNHTIFLTIAIDPIERAEMEEYSKEEYNRKLDSFKQQRGITEADIK